MTDSARPASAPREDPPQTMTVAAAAAVSLKGTRLPGGEDRHFLLVLRQGAAVGTVISMEAIRSACSSPFSAPWMWIRPWGLPGKVSVGAGVGVRCAGACA